MARKYEVGITGDTGPFAKAVKNGVIEPLEDAEKAFKDLDKEARSGNLDKEIDKAAKATDDLADELDEARSELKRLSYSARDVGDETKRGMDGASEGVENLKDEAKQSAKETAASFRDVTDALDLVQEIAANALVGFGPAGVAAGLIAAAGIGIAVGEFEKAAEAAEELRTKAVEYAQEALEAGVSTDRWFHSAEKLVQRINELEEQKSTDARWFWEDDPSKLEDWIDAYERLGREGEEVGDVLKMSSKDQIAYLEEQKDALEEVNEKIKEIQDSGKAHDNDADLQKLQALQDQAKAYDDIIGYTQEQIDLQEKSAETAERFKDAGVTSAQERAAAEEEAADRIQSAQEGVEQSALSGYDSMRNAAYEKATADDAAFDTNKWLEYVEQTRALADGYKANLATMKLTPEEWENFLALPEDARQNIAASYQTAGEDGKARIRAALSDTGSSAGSEATVGFEESFQPDADVTVDVDTADAAAQLDDLADKRTAEIEVKTTGKADAKTALDDLAKKRYASIDVSANTWDATATVNAWRRSQEARPVYITVKAKNGGATLT